MRGDRWKGRGGRGPGTQSPIVPWEPPAGAIYSSDFNVAENPISDSSKWRNGVVANGLWNNVKTINGIACAAAEANTLGSRYDDPTAHLLESYHNFAANQWCEGEIYRASGYNPNQGVTKHEIELLLRWEIGDGVSTVRGYEFIIGHDNGCIWVRWNGTRGSYDPISTVHYPSPAFADGDLIRVEISSTTMTAYRNGTPLTDQSVSNATWSDGQPGMGFWPVNDGTAPVIENFGWKNWAAGEL